MIYIVGWELEVASRGETFILETVWEPEAMLTWATLDMSETSYGEKRRSRWVIGVRMGRLDTSDMMLFFTWIMLRRWFLYGVC